MSTVRIPLGRDKYALIDEEDAPLVAGFHWHAKKGRYTFYATAYSSDLWRVKRVNDISMHRLIAEPGSGELVDHRDGNGLNNTRENLRRTTHSGNQRNRGSNRSSRSRFKGVYWDARRGRWMAQIYANGRSQFLGYHDTEENAARAYDTASLTLHGEFGFQNFPGG